MKNTKNRFENAPKLPSEYEKVAIYVEEEREDQVKEYVSTQNAAERFDTLRENFHANYGEIKSFNLAEYLYELYKNKKSVNMELMSYLLDDEDLDMLSVSKNGLSILMIAVLLNNVELVDFIISKYSDIKNLNLAEVMKNFYNETPKLRANWNDLDDAEYDPGKKIYDTIKYLLKKGIDIKSRCKNDNNTFLYAVLMRSKVLIKLFLECGADINEYEKVEFFDGKIYHATSLFYAASNKDIETCKYLIENGANIDIEYDLFHRMLHKESRLDNDDRGFLQVAIELQDYSLIKLVIQKHKDNNIPYAKGYYISPLLKKEIYQDIGDGHNIPIFNDPEKEIKEICSSIKLLSVCDIKVMKHANELKYKESTKPINIDYDATVSDCIDFAKKAKLFYSKENTNLIIELINDLYKMNADMNVYNPLKKSIFTTKNLDLIKLLINNGSSVNQINYNSDKNQINLLMEVCSSEKLGRKKLKIINLLIENGADIHYKDKNGNNILFHIIDAYQDKFSIDQYENENGEMITDTHELPKYSSEKILIYLLQNGADINHKNNMGMTPLMHYALKGEDRLVKILIDNGADINVKSEMTAFDLATNDDIKNLIKSTTNHTPQKLVKLLTNFTIDKPIKYTTHTWDFGSLNNSEYKNFDGYMSAVKSQFATMKDELKELSPNLYKKVYTFLLETNPDENYSWCSKGDINIGWSSLDELNEYCDSGKNPFDFRLKKAITLSDGTKIRKFEDIINLFKQEIQVRSDFKTLEKIFNTIGKHLPEDLILTKSKIEGEFYIDVEKITIALNKIFDPIKKRKELKNILVKLTMPESEYFELKIIHIDSLSTLNSKDLFKKVERGDFAGIKNNLTNLCDWSVEGSFENENFRINYLKSNNVKDIEKLENKPKGFTHVLRFYK
ncbi:MAG: hypothetical protein CL623_05900 [Arcobacter sp.]|nr:hypothetical protein [Arcobacter sp.]